MRNKLYLIGILTLAFCVNAFAQLTLPMESQRAEVSQIIGDTKVTMVYHRPNVKGRKVWGEAPANASGTGTLDAGNARPADAALVPYGHVWRVGANDTTTFEVGNDVKINGQPLPAGKYGLHAIPNKDQWTLIFSKTNKAWGSFTYDEKQDQLRVMTKPMTGEFQETMSLGLENIKATSADAVIRWENLRVPFTIDVGDVKGRTLAYVRQQATTAKADDVSTPVAAARWIYNEKLTANYDEALTWVDKSIAVRETFGALNLKAQMLAAKGKKQEAIATAEKAITIGKAATPVANTAALEKMLTDWKAGK